jgi:hypothetical protein
MNKKGIVMREVALWVLALFLLILLLMFLFDLPFLRWINFLPDKPGGGDDVVGDVGNDPFIGVSQFCKEEVGSLAANTGGMLRKFGEAIRLKNDERGIIIDGAQTAFFWKESSLGGSIYVIKDVKIGRVVNGVIDIDKDAFDDTSRIGWKIWENYLVNSLPSERESFFEQMNKLNGAEMVRGLLICFNGDEREEIEVKVWPEKKLKVDKYSSSENVFIKYLDYSELKNYDINYLVLEKRNDHFIIKGKNPWYQFDKTFGLLFRDGSIWIRQVYLKENKIISEKYRSDFEYERDYKITNTKRPVPTIPEDNLSIYFAKTNIFVEESNLVVYFK